MRNIIILFIATLLLMTSCAEEKVTDDQKIQQEPEVNKVKVSPLKKYLDKAKHNCVVGYEVINKTTAVDPKFRRLLNPVNENFYLLFDSIPSSLGYNRSIGLQQFKNEKLFYYKYEEYNGEAILSCLHFHEGIGDTTYAILQYALDLTSDSISPKISDVYYSQYYQTNYFGYCTTDFEVKKHHYQGRKMNPTEYSDIVDATTISLFYQNWTNISHNVVLDLTHKFALRALKETAGNDNTENSLVFNYGDFLVGFCGVYGGMTIQPEITESNDTLFVSIWDFGGYSDGPERLPINILPIPPNDSIYKLMIDSCWFGLLWDDVEDPKYIYPMDDENLQLNVSFKINEAIFFNADGSGGVWTDQSIPSFNSSYFTPGHGEYDIQPEYWVDSIEVEVPNWAKEKAQKIVDESKEGGGYLEFNQMLETLTVRFEWTNNVGKKEKKFIVFDYLYGD